MPAPVKPCEGRFSEELQATLASNKDRVQWAVHPCEVCGVEVGATLDKGKWVPEQHWPSVKYPRKTVEKKPQPQPEHDLSDDTVVLAPR